MRGVQETIASMETAPGGVLFGAVQTQVHGANANGADDREGCPCALSTSPLGIRA